MKKISKKTIIPESIGHEKKIEKINNFRVLCHEKNSKKINNFQVIGHKKNSKNL